MRGSELDATGSGVEQGLGLLGHLLGRAGHGESIQHLVGDLPAGGSLCGWIEPADDVEVHRHGGSRQPPGGGTILVDDRHRPDHNSNVVG